MQEILNILRSLLPSVGIVLTVIILLLINSWVFKKLKVAASYGRVIRKSVTFFLIFAGALVFILTIPYGDESLRGDILTFLAVILSAGIALSSTTILGNLIAGFMNNSMNRFRNGDLINIGELHGRVIKKSIFHVEIQLEDSNFMTIPNLFIANNPVKLTRKTNTVVSASVSLGYDVSRIRIEEALKAAAVATGLSEPYVYITNLGDFSVVYKIHGFLDDSGKFFSTCSLLNSNVMDALHAKGIEIVSPTFMNQRRVDDKVFLSKPRQEKTPVKDAPPPEDLIFDEAIKSEKIEKKKDYLKEIENKQQSLKEKLKGIKEENEIEKIKSSIRRMEDIKTKISKNIEEQSQN